MNIDKSHLKMLTAQEYGKKIDNLEGKAAADVHRNEGALSVIKIALASLDNERAIYKKEVEEDKLSAEQCKVHMEVLARASGCLVSLQNTARLNKATADGVLSGIKLSGDIIESGFKEEKKKAEDFLANIESGIAAEDAGRPGDSVRDDIDKRKAEAQKKKKAASKKKAPRKKRASKKKAA